LQNWHPLVGNVQFERQIPEAVNPDGIARYSISMLITGSQSQTNVVYLGSSVWCLLCATIASTDASARNHGVGVKMWYSTLLENCRPVIADGGTRLLAAWIETDAQGVDMRAEFVFIRCCSWLSRNFHAGSHEQLPRSWFWKLTTGCNRQPFGDCQPLTIVV